MNCPFLIGVPSRLKFHTVLGLVLILGSMVYSLPVSAKNQFQCVAKTEVGYEFSLALPDSADESLMSVAPNGKGTLLNSGEIGVGRIDVKYGALTIAHAFAVTRFPRPGFSLLGFYVTGGTPFTLWIDTEANGPYPFELYDPFDRRGKIAGNCS